jgi:hypothetical protein
MAHFAELDENSVVKQVIVVANPELLEDGIESESKGIAFCQNLLGEDKKWIQTSWSGSFRYNFAGIGYIYDAIDDAFIAPMPKCGHDSLLLTDKKRWECETCAAEIMQIWPTA